MTPLAELGAYTHPSVDIHIHTRILLWPSAAKQREYKRKVRIATIAEARGRQLKELNVIPRPPAQQARAKGIPAVRRSKRRAR